MIINSNLPFNKRNYIIAGTAINSSPINTLLRGLNLPDYNENTEKDLLTQHDYTKLISVQDCINGYNHSAFVSKYTILKDFDELAQSKYFNTPQNFRKLTTIISILEQKKNNAIVTVCSPYFKPTMPDLITTQANTDISGCIHNINKFFKSNFSDDLKEYIKDNTDVLTDLQKTSTNLYYLDEQKPDVKYLSGAMFGLM